MKKFFVFFVALAVLASFAAPAFAGTTVDFEKKNSSSIISFSDYGDNLTGVTIEESTEQAHSGSTSVKVTVKADEAKVVDDKAFFTLMLLASDTSSPVSKMTETDVANFFYYMPEDSNIAYISVYICDETSWDYCSAGTIEPSSFDEWVNFYDEIDYIRFDEDSRTGSEGTNTMPCAIMFECYLLDTDTDVCFYLDDFYFGEENGEGAASEPADEPTAAPSADDKTADTSANDDQPTTAPVSDATPAPETGSSNDNTVWIIVGCVIAAAVVVAAAVIIISKKKK